MSSRDWTLIAFLAVLSNSSCSVAVSDEGEQLAAHDATPLVYESSVAKPVQLKFQRLSAEVPAGYELEKLIGSLPDRSALTLGFFIYGDANSRAVAIAVVGDSARRMFVDRDRDQTFAEAEEVAGGVANDWPVDVDAEFVTGINQYTHDPRCVRIRLDGPTGELEVATRGCMQGKSEKEGYQHLFQGLESVDQLPRFARRRPTSAPHVPRDSVTRFTIPQLQGIGRQLLDSVPAPRGGATTFNRCLLYFGGLAAVAPADAMRILSAPDANLPSQESLLAYCVSDIVQLDPPYAARLVGATTDQWYRCFHWINLARDESDLDVRTEYVSEALVAARQLAGERYLTAMANVAMLLWELGSSTEARDVVREAWDRSPELQALVASGERNDRVPASPSFAAAWGLVDPEAAMTLAALTARPEMVKYYQTEVLLLVADSNREAFDKMIAPFGYANLQVDGIEQFLNNHGIRDVAAVTSLARQLPESIDRAEILTILARRAHELSDGAARELCREALQTLNQLDLSRAEDDARSDYSARMTASVRNVALACPDLVPAFLFASMQLWSDQRRDGDDFAQISGLASAVARYDPGLARDLLEPCFEELSWLYDETRGYFTYSRCSPVQAALRSDPDWAAEVVRGICATGLAGSDMHRTELVCGAIDELRAMIVDLHRREKTIR